MYNKIRNMCGQLNDLTREELRNNGIEALLIMGVNTQLDCFEFTKGDIPSILSLLGSALSTLSKTTEFTLEELLSMIYENETILEQLRKEGDKE